MQSHLLAGSAVIEYDDMHCDFLPHGALNRMLTSEYLIDRLLGVSKTVKVSTRASDRMALPAPDNGRK